MLFENQVQQGILVLEGLFQIFQVFQLTPFLQRQYPQM